MYIILYYILYSMYIIIITEICPIGETLIEYLFLFCGFFTLMLYTNIKITRHFS